MSGLNAIKVLFLCFLTSALAQGAPRLYGIDALGGSKYGSVIVNSHPDGFALGIFTQKDLFGDAYPVVDEALAKRRIPLVRYNLRWSDSHSFSARDFPKIVAEARRFVPLVNKYPNVECQFSGATEHQLNAKLAQQLANAVLAIIPERCSYVNNPWEGKGSFIPATSRILNEVHGSKAQKPRIGGRYNWSADGSDVFDFDITKLKNRLSDADVFFFWTSQNNGRRNAADPTPRPQRKFWPTGDLMRMQAYLATDEGTVKLPKRFLYKSKSDQHFPVPAKRELKPVFIVPPAIKSLELRRGNEVFKGAKPQPFADGRVRFYMPDFGYRMGPSLEIFGNGKKMGTVNGGFRTGTYRL